MILRRLGNKKRIAHKIIPHFPPHKIYIEPFFGAGGMFFSKPKAKYNIVNDLDSDVFNLFQVIKNYPDKFRECLEITPYHTDVFNHFKTSEEEDIIWRAVGFVHLSNFGYLGQTGSLHFSMTNSKKIALKQLEDTINFLKDTSIKFMNTDFRNVVKNIPFKTKSEIDGAFIYCDPPYLNTGDNYSDGFTPEQTSDLFQTLIETGCKFAVSEFDNPVILDLAKQHNLEVITIGERSNLKNRRTEVLIVNYESPNIYGLFGSNNANN